MRRDNLREALTRSRKRVEPAGYRRLRWFLGTVADRIIARVRDGALVEDELLAPGEMEVEFRRAFRPYLNVCVHAGLEFERRWIESAAPGLQRQEAPGLPSIHVDLSPALAANVAAHLDARTRIAWAGISRTMREAVAAELARAIKDGDDLKTRIKRIRAKAARMGEIQAARIARTEATSSLNFGQQAEREDVGISHKEWVSVLDSRTRTYGDGDRFDHLIPDGQVVRNNEPFVVSGEKLRFPGDSSLGASSANVINCRCASVAAWPDDPLDPAGAAAVKLPEKTPTAPTPPPPQPPPGITFSGTPTEFTRRVWKAIGKGVKTEADAVKVGKVIAADIDSRLGRLRREVDDAATALAKAQILEEKALAAADKSGDMTDYAEHVVNTRDAERDWVAAENVLESARVQRVLNRLVEVRDTGGTFGLKSNRSKFAPRVQDAAVYFPSDWIKRSNAHGKMSVRKTTSPRAFHRAGEIHLNQRSGSAMTVHELVHRMEWTNQDLVDLEREYLEKRIKAAGATARVPYTPAKSELVWDVGLFDEYAGKDYSNAFELLTMGWQHLTKPHGNPELRRNLGARFRAWDDADFRNFVLGVFFGA